VVCIHSGAENHISKPEVYFRQELALKRKYCGRPLEATAAVYVTCT
jgi:hypothetical protein